MMVSMTSSTYVSPRLAWVKAHAAQLIDLAASYGARRLSLCGSVSRGTDHNESDIDFYVWEFDIQSDGASERQRADQLVNAIRSLSPYKVDVRGIPGWLVDPKFEVNMQRDAINLSTFVKETSTSRITNEGF